MKKFRRIMALLIATVMVFSMGAVAFASENENPPAEGETTATTYKITIDVSGNKATHTYKIYQIFTGTPEDGQLSNVRYGSSFGTEGELVDGDILKAIQTQADARAWVKANKDNFGSPVETLSAAPYEYDAAPGWYVIFDTDYTYAEGREQDDTDAYSAYIVEVVDAATPVTPKNNAPTVDKEVQDDEDPEWSESADHEIGETFQFRLTATLPSDINYAAYETYPITFNDVMSDGVTFESIDTVTVDGQEITDYDCTATAGQAGGSWTLTIEDVKTVEGVDLTNGADVVVTYNAHLNTNAIKHNESAEATETNNNKVSLTYNNNPDATGGSDTDTTPEDFVWVFTYKSENTKVDADGEPVVGAGFTLKDKNGTAIQLYKAGGVYYVYYADKTDYPEGGEVVTEMVTTADSNAFNIEGLDVGTYTLEETTVPDGFTKCADIAVKIEATHSENENLTSADLTLTEENLNNEVVNKSGATLPETGGMGTTLFYIVGAALVIGAGVVLVSRRRMGAN